MDQLENAESKQIKTEGKQQPNLRRTPTNVTQVAVRQCEN